jgi:outer membrane protein OmpA-like peptidoglycan-associated protein
MVFTLGGSLLFTSGSTDLQPGALMTLQNVAQIMQKYPNLRVRVEGFTDSRGSDALNDALSRDRAAAVAQALQNDGVDPSRLEVIGHGKSMPVATNSSAVGRQFNRRVALVFSGFGGPSQTASTQPPEQLR